MFGYVVPNRSELKVKDYELYRSFYCGLCRELLRKYGISGQLTLTYDLTFVILLLSGLYEPPVTKGKMRCVVSPIVSHPVRKNRFTVYAADMNLILAYEKCKDDWNDEKKLLRLAYARLLEGKAEKASADYSAKAASIRKSLAEISLQEEQRQTDIDQMAGLFGNLLGEVLCFTHDQWEPKLRELGFYLGKYIYLLDAYEDVEGDLERGNYNPLGKMYATLPRDTFDDQVKHLLLLSLSRTCRTFEALPILRYSDILRNILYSGVWLKFESVKKKRREEGKKKNA